jgi:hypothetical protein
MVVYLLALIRRGVREGGAGADAWRLPLARCRRVRRVLGCCPTERQGDQIAFAVVPVLT